MTRRRSRAGRKPLPAAERRSRRIVLLVREAEGEAIPLPARIIAAS